MFVLIKYIPSDIHIVSLWNIVDPLVTRKNIFRQNDSLKSIKVFKRVFRDESHHQWYALARVSSEKAGKRLIKSINDSTTRLNNALLDSEESSHKVSATEFFIRHHSRDRRDNAEEKIIGKNRRNNDRRRLDSKMLPIAEISDIDVINLQKNHPRLLGPSVNLQC